jgi:hypothetical protein
VTFYYISELLFFVLERNLSVSCSHQGTHHDCPSSSRQWREYPRQKQSKENSFRIVFLFLFLMKWKKKQNGDTMLMIAVRNEAFEIVQALLRHSSGNIDEKNEVIFLSKKL